MFHLATFAYNYFFKEIGTALSEQLPSYDKDPELKRVALKHLGLILQKASKKDFIK